MLDAILVLNAGSSSLKFTLFSIHEDSNLVPELRGQIEGIGTAPQFKAKDEHGKVVGNEELSKTEHATQTACLNFFGKWLRGQLGDLQVKAVGHRVVHGGMDFAAPVMVSEDVLEKLDALVPLAPLHQPHNVGAIRAVARALPDMPQVACFDTSFHRSQPQLAQAFALPKSITSRGVRRYGFHGLSYEYIASAMPRYDANAAAGRVVVCHLGNGSSMCAVANGKSVASTMGFTAVDGLPMGTRCGSLDPGVVLYLMDEMNMDARAIENLVYKQSGLLGVSGVSSDMRTLEASTEPDAKLAIDLYMYRIGRELGSLVAALGGLDALVFTAGIGENSKSLRSRVVRDAAWLGVELDEAANEAKGPRISTAVSRVSAWVIPTNEELMIAQHTRRVVGI
ncbi:MAG: acetate/propionate family kinase [Burkholderiales bacterium]